MFDFFGIIINKVALFVVAMVGFIIPGVGEPVVYDAPAQDEVVVVPSISTTSPPSEQEELELLKEEVEAVRAEAVEERLRAERAKGEAAAERGRAEKARAEAETIRVDAERQRLQAEVDRLKAAAVVTQEKKEDEPKTFTLPSGAIIDENGNVLNQAELDAKKQQEEVNKGTYCNGTYWKQCAAGQEFVCPSSGNAYCYVPPSSTELSRAANDKAEIINLINEFINDINKFDDAISSEISYVNNILYQLTSLSGEATDLLNELSILQRDSLLASQDANNQILQHVENYKGQLQSYNIESFLDKEFVSTTKNLLNDFKIENIQSEYALEKRKAFYEDSVRVYISILNIVL